MNRADEPRRDGNRLKRWLAPLALALASTLYLLWRRLRGRAERPPPGPGVVQMSHHPAGEEAALPRLPLEEETRGEQGVNPLLVLLFSTLLMVGVAFVLLIFFDRLPPSVARVLPESPFFNARLFGAYDASLAPVPVLQPAGVAGRKALAEREQERLDSFGWISEEEGIAHIPLELALELVVTRGLPAPPPTATPQPPAATPAAAQTTDATPSPGAATPAPEPDPTAAAAGADLFADLGCNDCHPGGGAGTGPSLVGLPGSEVELQTGETVIADRDYIRRSILYPGADIVAGYSGIMPSFQGELDDRELEQLIAYIHSLAGDTSR